ncbi:hypothetical protein ACQY0O_000091 [Thecaphora frezii]
MPPLLSHSGFDAAPNASSDDVDLTSPSNLRKLVLNYLVHHCYADTATAFAKDGISHYFAPDSHATRTTNRAHSSPSSASPSSSPSSSAPALASGSNPPAADAGSRSAEPAHASHLRGPLAQGSRQAHPLSAPPLSHEDSSMEVEADSLLALANGASSAANPDVVEQDEAMADASSRPRTATNGHSNAPLKGVWNGNGHSNGSGYEAAAEEQVDGVETHGDLSSAEVRAVKMRKEIRDHIIEGRIRMAIDLCNAHFPSVLNGDALAGSARQSSKARAHARTADDAASLLHVPTRQPSPTSAPGDRVLPANPTSLDPSHLLLNLQIQVFIEIIRSATASNPGLASAPSPQLSSPAYLPAFAAAAHAPGIAAASISRAASPAPSSSSSTGSATSATGSAAAVNPALHSALAMAQSLYTSAQRLPSYWRAMYLKELEQVTALLAYPDVEHSPVRRFLHRSRKVALAEQVNSAILFRTGKPSQPLIESAVRQTAFIYNTLHAEKVAVPHDHAVFSVAGCPSGPYEETLSKKNGGGKVLPPWSFRNFLAER